MLNRITFFFLWASQQIDIFHFFFLPEISQKYGQKILVVLATSTIMLRHVGSQTVLSHVRVAAVGRVATHQYDLRIIRFRIVRVLEAASRQHETLSQFGGWEKNWIIRWVRGDGPDTHETRKSSLGDYEGSRLRSRLRSEIRGRFWGGYIGRIAEEIYGGLVAHRGEYRMGESPPHGGSSGSAYGYGIRSWLSCKALLPPSPQCDLGERYPLGTMEWTSDDDSAWVRHLVQYRR